MGGKKADGPPKKKLKLVSDRARHFYAPMHAEDAVSYERNLDLIKQEQSKSRPRVEYLMRQTFANRFDALINSTDPVTASDHVAEFPLLKKPTYVSCYVLIHYDVRTCIHCVDFRNNFSYQLKVYRVLSSRHFHRGGGSKLET